MIKKQFLDAFKYSNLEEISDSIKAFGVNYQNGDGKSIIMIASRWGRTHAVDMLIENGADLDLQDETGRTALMYASEYEKKDVVKKLINSGANLDIKDKYGWTALMHASKFGRLEIVNILIENGADINIKNNNKLTAYHLAVAKNKVLIAYLLNPEINDDITCKLLMKSCRGKNETEILFLHENGVDFHKKNNAGRSAYDVLIKKRNLTPTLQALTEKIGLEQLYEEENEMSFGL